MSKISQRLIEAANRASKDMLDKLEADAYELCKKAQQTKETRNRTGAQSNAFFFIITFNGYILRVGAPPRTLPDDEHRGLEGTWWGKDTGSGWWNDFDEAQPEQNLVLNPKTGRWQTKNTRHHINEVAPEASYSRGSFDIYILNAAYYTGWLEQGMKGGRWRVISQIKADCDSLARKYSYGVGRTEVKRIGLGGEPFKPASF